MHHGIFRERLQDQFGNEAGEQFVILNVERIIETYIARKNVDKYAYVASLDEIKQNDYNINIPRYVDTFEEEEPIDINEVRAKIKKLDEEIVVIDKQI